MVAGGRAATQPAAEQLREHLAAELEEFSLGDRRMLREVVKNCFEYQQDPYEYAHELAHELYDDVIERIVRLDKRLKRHGTSNSEVSAKLASRLEQTERASAPAALRRRVRLLERATAPVALRRRLQRLEWEVFEREAVDDNDDDGDELSDGSSAEWG